MTDTRGEPDELLERLRNPPRGGHCSDEGCDVCAEGRLMADAANEIEALQAENAELRDLLTEVADFGFAAENDVPPGLALRLSTYRTEGP